MVIEQLWTLRELGFAGGTNKVEKEVVNRYVGRVRITVTDDWLTVCLCAGKSHMNIHNHEKPDILTVKKTLDYFSH